jgi:hypothetical protein
MTPYNTTEYLLDVALRNIRTIELKTKGKELDIEQNLRDVISALGALSDLVSKRKAQK